MADIAFKIYQKSLQDNGSLIVSGTASTNIKDRDNEAITITPKALKEALPKFYADNAPMKVEHAMFVNNITGEMFAPNQAVFTSDCTYCFPEFADRNVGKVLNMTYSPEEYDIDSPNPLKMEITAVCCIFDPLAIQKVLAGELGSFSLAWRALAEPWTRSSGQELHTAIKIDELTLCKVPANPEAKIESFKVVTNEDLEKQYGLKMGQDILAYDRVGKLKSVFVSEAGQLKYELEYSQDYLKSVLVDKESTQKAVTDLGCVMATYEPTQFKALTDQINKEDLYEDPDEPLENGLAKEFHTTLLYGLLPDVSLDKVQNTLESLKEKPEVKGIKIFSNPDKPFDVVVLEMISEEFIKANETLKTLPYKNDYPKYIPHTTIAYVKKGVAVDYTTLNIPEGLNFDIQSVVYSQGGNITKLKSKYENLNTRFNQTNLEKKAIENETKEQNKLDEVYSKYHDLVNMSYSELKKWSENPLSKLASLNREAVNRNLKLLSKNKEDWTDKDITEANKTISFISRMSKMAQGQNIRKEGKDLGISKRDISLRNWAFDPSKKKASFDPTDDKRKAESSMIFDERGFYRILKEAFAKQNENLTEQDLVNFVYKTIPFRVTFGDTKQYSTKIQIGSDKQIKFVEPITEIKDVGGSQSN